MKRYWWVNHKQTFRKEIRGGYLWSPKKESGGARSRFYDNMRKASPGDTVLSFADTRISFVGEVLDFAVCARMPAEFGAAGKNWNKEGWLLPVSWQKLMLPVQPKAILQRLAPLLPARHSPFHAISGRGNQKAYLAEIDRRVFEEVMRAAGAGPLSPRPQDSPSNALEELLERLARQEERRLETDEALSATERDQVITARKGQGNFRRDLEQIESGCRITGIRNPQLLRASHIKPWRLCETSHERLDGCNGLLLAPHVDVLFDSGLFTISKENRVLLSPRLDRQDLSMLRLADLEERSVGEFLPAQVRYLEYHRETIFQRQAP